MFYFVSLVKLYSIIISSMKEPVVITKSQLLLMEQSNRLRRASLHNNYFIAIHYPSNQNTSASHSKLISSLKSMQNAQKHLNVTQGSKLSESQDQNQSRYASSSCNTISDYSCSAKTSKRLMDFTNLSLETSLMTVVKIIKEVSSLWEKSRDVKLNEQRVWITPSGNVFILSQIPKNSKNQYFCPTARQQTKIGKKIMEIVSKVSEKRFQDFHAYYHRSLSKHPDCDFKHLKSLIKSYCACAKIQLSEDFSTHTIEYSTSSKGKSLSSNEYKGKMKTQVSWEQRTFFGHKNNNLLSPNSIKHDMITKSEIKSPIFIKQRKVSLQIDEKKQKTLISQLSQYSKDQSFQQSLHPISCKTFRQKESFTISEQSNKAKKTKDSLDTFKDSIASTNKSSAYFGSLIKNSFEGGEQEKKDLKINLFSLVNSGLEEVESQEGQNSEGENNEQINCSQKQYGKEQIDSSINSLEDVLSFNLKGLIKPCKSQIQESIIIGKQMPRKDWRVGKLDRLVTAIHESMITEDKN